MTNAIIHVICMEKYYFVVFNFVSHANHKKINNKHFPVCKTSCMHTLIYVRVHNHHAPVTTCTHRQSMSKQYKYCTRIFGDQFFMLETLTTGIKFINFHLLDSIVDLVEEVRVKMLSMCLVLHLLLINSLSTCTLN